MVHDIFTPSMKMATTIKKSSNQNDLRKLMKERREKKSEDTVRIDSPLAKYDEAGKLSCTVCNVHIKKESLWSSHIVGPVHRQNLETLKRKRTLLNRSSSRDETTPKKLKTEKSSVRQQRKGETSPTTPKKTKQDESIRPTIHFDYQDDVKETAENGADINESDDTKNVLPTDFFDKDAVQAQKSANPAEALPQGFFDDPKMDAKIRKVEYKDPMDEEWERFQKTINEENTVSQAMIEEEIEESKVEREIDEIDEQIHNWARVQSLQKKKESILHKQDDLDNFSDNSASDEREIEDMLDWRAKGVLKKAQN